MAMIGYARVSTEDQTPLPQADDLRAAGCRDIHEEQASGASRSRPLEAKGAHFRSLRDPIDTTSPQGKFTLQVLGAAAELERALIRERTVAGLRSAKAQGRIGGNPGLRARDPAALRKVAAARDETYFNQLNMTAEEWVPQVRRLRPDMPWEDLVRGIHGPLPRGRPDWTVERLTRAVKRYVLDGLLET